MTIEHADGLPDDRVCCGDCTQFKRGTNYCGALRMVTWPDLPLRCLRYVPGTTDHDKRTGRERWPNLNQNIEEARRLDAAHREFKGETHDHRTEFANA